ncbi:hypothetical protein QFC22_005238 [Naganishia vaughanmartiniae]|uniref:Uncharacterized protein n=1 Tax=Naganishia vaughanmartiniae TaxID=1424756 RepID=A0ACC2WUM7_9TREE|nr:hypothetical protein QFC22_005238 [Naganishia vaughanmartiniae]
MWSLDGTAKRRQSGESYASGQPSKSSPTAPESPSALVSIEQCSPSRNHPTFLRGLSQTNANLFEGGSACVLNYTRFGRRDRRAPRASRSPVCQYRSRASVEGAIKKLDKYIKRFLKNKWVCAAMALNPTVRKQGLRKLLIEECDMPDRYKKTPSFIKSRVKHYRKQVKDQQGDFQIVGHARPVPKRANRFTTTQYDAGQQEITHNPGDVWECYNSDLSRFKCINGEPAIQYWKSMAQHRDMVPLVLARSGYSRCSVLSASAERLFSHVGCKRLKLRSILPPYY